MALFVVLAYNAAYNITQLYQLEGQSNYDAILALTAGFDDDPKPLYFRAIALAATANADAAAQAFAKVVSNASPYKFKAVLKLKQLCTEHCELACETRFNQAIFGKDGVSQLQNLTAWRSAVLAAPTVEEIDLLLQKCPGDPELAVLKTRQLILDGDFAYAKRQLRGVQNEELTSLLDKVASCMDFTFYAFEASSDAGEAASDTTSGDSSTVSATSQTAMMREIQAVLTNTTLFVHKPHRPYKVTRASRLIAELDFSRLSAEIGEVYHQLETVLSQLYRTDFKLDFTPYLARLADYVSLLPGAAALLKTGKVADSVDTSKITSPDAVALCSVQQATEIFQKVQALRVRYEAHEDIDDELYALEQASEVVRRALNRAKFSRVGAYLPHIDFFIDEINAVFDAVAQLRLDTLVPDFFYVLNTTRDASAAEIKKKYYQKAQQLHPDNLPADITPAQRRAAQREFQRVAEAYAVLTDKDKREKFEQGMYGAEERSQRVGIHNNRKQAAYTVPPDYVGKGNQISDEELRKFMSEQQWSDYMRNKKFGRA